MVLSWANTPVFCIRKAYCPHRYEQLTEMLVDVEVDIFRPWAQNATRKDTVVAVWVVHGSISPCSTKVQSAVVGAA